MYIHQTMPTLDGGVSQVAVSNCKFLELLWRLPCEANYHGDLDWYFFLSADVVLVAVL